MEVTNKRQEDLIVELNKLSKRANQRILTIERLTKRKSPQFATKELADYLSVTGGLTKRKGKSVRVSMYKKSMTETDVLGTIKALDKFLNYETTSTVKGIKEFTKTQSAKLGKKLTYAQASAIYRARNEWKDIFEHVNESEFWNYYNITYRCVRGGATSFETFYSDMFTLWRDTEHPLQTDMNKMDKDTLDLLHKVYDYITKGD